MAEPLEYSLRRMKRHRDGQRGERQQRFGKALAQRGTLPATGPGALAGGAVASAHPPGSGIAGLLARWSNRGWVLGLLLVLAIIFAYAPAWHGGFLWDDDAHVTKNRMLVEADGWRDRKSVV